MEAELSVLLSIKMLPVHPGLFLHRFNGLQ
jgi:hypothetical protein